MQIKSVTIIGVGAVGAVIATQLNDYLGKENVQCLADGERKTRYEKDGLFLNGRKLDFNYVSSMDAKETDLIIIATKNLQLDQAMQMMRKAYGKNTIILSLLNGIQSERELIKSFGRENVLYSYVISLNSIHEGNRIEVSDFGTLVFGEGDNSKTERTKALEELFTAAGIRYKNPDDIHLAMWKKFLINVTFNTLSAITRSTYGGFRFDVMQKLARQAGNEVVAVANAEGIALTPQMIEEDIQQMCGHDPYGKTSMLQDMEARRKSENAFFCGTIVKLAEKHNICVPYCAFLADLIEGTEIVRTL